jgi:hypothetical protein
MLHIWLQCQWHLNIYVCWTNDYIIRDIYIFTYDGPVTTISVTSKYLCILDLLLQYPWLLNIYICWTVTTLSVTKYLYWFRIYWKYDYTICDFEICTYAAPIHLKVAFSVCKAKWQNVIISQNTWYLNLSL